MKEIISFINSHKNGCLATVEDGQPRVRPWAFMLEDGGKFWFCTANNKDVFKQLKQNPQIEFTSWESFNILRLSGKVTFSDDFKMKAKIMESSPGPKHFYQNPENPLFEIFYLDHGKATLSGKTYEF